MNSIRENLILERQNLQAGIGLFCVFVKFNSETTPRPAVTWEAIRESFGP